MNCCSTQEGGFRRFINIVGATSGDSRLQQGSIGHRIAETTSRTEDKESEEEAGTNRLGAGSAAGGAAAASWAARAHTAGGAAAPGRAAEPAGTTGAAAGCLA